MSVGALAVRHEVASAAMVRHSIADDLAGRAVCRESIDDVVLVASELVGNAVVHTLADPTSGLDITWDVESDDPGAGAELTAVVVRVADQSIAAPRPRTTDERDTGGRGLAIVAAIASDWGVRCSAMGKQVWARVPITMA
jgi:anti-sigma regulatory factor (Ser/Thr protein kinase)